MVHHQQFPHTLVADTVLAGQDQRVGEELLTDGADQLPLNVLDGNLVKEAQLLKRNGRIDTSTSEIFS